MAEPPFALDVFLPGQPGQRIDGRVARMIKYLVANRTEIERMMVGSVMHHVGKTSVQSEIKVVDERVEVLPDPDVTDP